MVLGVRKRLIRRRTKKILDERCDDLSVEYFIGRKMKHFFERLGSHEAYDLYDLMMTQIERPMIETALEWANGNRLKAARALGVNRNTLRAKIRKLKIRI